MKELCSLRQALRAFSAALLAVSFSAVANDIQEAIELLKSSRYPQALERVDKVLAAKPKDAQARFLKGLIFAEQGNSKEATDIFLALTKDHPDLPEPYNNLAVIYASQGQYDKARAALEQSIRTHPSYATAYENLGDVYAKLASQAYDKALQIDSSNVGAKNKLSLVRDMVGGAAPGRPAAVAATPAPKETARASAAVAAVPSPAAVAATPAPKEAAKATAVVAVVPSAETAKPATPKPVGEKPPTTKPTDVEVIEAVNAWARAWSSRDVEAYLSFYSRDFKTPGGVARDDWEKARRHRITAPKSISVSIESPKVRIAAEGQANVTFRQSYRSDVIKPTNTVKTLVLGRTEGRWLIQQERVGN